jgi:hypothetical protein
VQDFDAVADTTTQATVGDYVRVRFDFPDRMELDAFVDLLANLREIADFAGSVAMAVTRLTRPPGPPDELGTHVYRVRYGSELTILLDAARAVGGSAFLVWFLTFARDLPGRFRESVEAGRQATLRTRQLEASVRIEEAQAASYEAAKEVQLLVCRLLKTNLRDNFREISGVVDRVTGLSLEEFIESGGLFSDEVLQAIIRIGPDIKSVEVVDRPSADG